MKKTYVISDVHSHLDVLEEFLNDIGKNDKVYFLGDACDKGPDGINTLLKIMEDPRVTMIMGNHDLMLLEWYNWKKQKEEEEGGKELDFTTSFFSGRAYDLWVGHNYGKPTMESFESLDEKTQKEIIEYLKNLPLVVSVKVPQKGFRSKKFLLCHSVPYMIPLDIPGAILYDGNEMLVEEFVWEREHFIKEPGYTIVCGHTQTFGIQDRWVKRHEGYNFDIYKYPEKDPHWIDVDCGLASNLDGCKLCALCLNDMSVKYYTPKKFITL